MAIFDDWDFGSELKGLKSNSLETEANVNLKYYIGDTFDYWIGPVPSPSDPYRERILAETKRVYSTYNLVGECIDRHITALVGKLPNWYLKNPENGNRFVSKEELEKNDQKLSRNKQSLELKPDALEPLERNLQTWVEESKLQEQMIKAVFYLTVCRVGYIRIYDSDKKADSLRGNGSRQGKDGESFAKTPIFSVNVHCPPRGSVTIKKTDEDDIESIEYRFNKDNRTFLEKQTQDPDTGELIITTESVDGTGESQEIRTGLYDTWTIFELTAPSLITRSVKSAQDSLNLTLTMMDRNVIQGGFLERVIMNAQTPGEWIDDLTSPGGKKFVPNPSGLEIGAGKTTFLSPIAVGDPENPTYLNPSIQYKDPTGVSTFTDTLAFYVKTLYHLFGQGHMNASGDGNVSGVSRQQLRGDFLITLLRQKSSIENAYNGIFNLLLQILGFSDGDVPVRAVSQLRMSTSLPTPDELAEIRSSKDSGLFSKTTSMSQMGVEDPDAELALIRQEKLDEAKFQKDNADLLKYLVPHDPSQGDPSNGSDNPALTSEKGKISLNAE